HVQVPWEPVYAASKWTDLLRADHASSTAQARHPGRLGVPGPVIIALLNAWPEQKATEPALSSTEVADAVLFMPRRIRAMSPSAMSWSCRRLRIMTIIPPRYVGAAPKPSRPKAGKRRPET